MLTNDARTAVTGLMSHQTHYRSY